MYRKITHHPNILHPHCYNFIRKTCQFAYGGDDLFQYLSDTSSSFTEEQVKNYISHLARAVNHCHQHGIVHGDIKLENILIDENQCIRLIDFSSALEINKWKDSPRLPYHGVRSSIPYMAPELHSTKRISNHMLFYIDYYAMGVCVYVLLMKEYPYKRNYNIEQLTNIGVSTECIDFFKQATSTSPWERQNLLQHPWLQINEIPL